MVNSIIPKIKFYFINQGIQMVCILGIGDCRTHIEVHDIFGRDFPQSIMQTSSSIKNSANILSHHLVHSSNILGNSVAKGANLFSNTVISSSNLLSQSIKESVDIVSNSAQVLGNNVIDAAKELKAGASTAGYDVRMGLTDFGLSSVTSLQSFAVKSYIAHSILTIGSYALSYIVNTAINNWQVSVQVQKHIIDAKTSSKYSDYVQALNEIDLAIRLDDSAVCRLVKADILANLGDNNAAITEYGHALSRVGGDWKLKGSILVNLSQAHFNLGQYKDAIQSLEGALEHLDDGSHQSYFIIAECYEKLNYLNEADLFIRKAIMISESNSEKYTKYYGLLGLITSKMGNYLESIEHFNNAIHNDPNDKLSLYYLGWSYLELKNFNAAINQFNTLIGIDKNIKYYVPRGIALYSEGKYNDAESAFNAVIQEFHNSDISYFYLAQINYQNQNWDLTCENIEEAINYYNQQLEKNDILYLNYLKLAGLGYFEKKDHLKALKYFEDFIRIKEPTNNFMFLNKKYYELKNKYNASNQEDNYENVADLAGAYFELGMYFESLKIYEDGLKKAQGNNKLIAEYEAKIADCYLKLGNLQEAQTHYEATIKLEPHNSIFNQKLGNFYLQKSYNNQEEVNTNNVREALKYYKEALKHDKSYESYIDVGNCYYLNKELKKAEDYYRAALSQITDEKADFVNKNEISVINKFSLGSIYLKQGSYDVAEKIFNEIIKVKPANSLYHAALGQVLQQQHKLKGAIREYENSINFTYKNELRQLFYKKLVDLYTEDNQLDKAFKAFLESLISEKYSVKKISDISKEILEFLPDTLKSLDNLFITMGHVCYALGVFDEAAKKFEVAIKKNPNNIEYYMYAGNAYYNLGDYEQAKEKYEKLAKIKEDAISLSKLGDAYYALKMYQEAKKAYNKAINKEDNNHILYNKLADAYYYSAEKSVEEKDKLREYKEAGKNFQIAIDKSDNDINKALYYNNIAAVYMKLENYSAAQDNCNNALKLDPTNQLYQNNCDEINYKIRNINMKSISEVANLNSDNNHQAIAITSTNPQTLQIPKKDYQIAIKYDFDNRFIHKSPVLKAIYKFYTETVGKDPNKAVIYSTLTNFFNIHGQDPKKDNFFVYSLANKLFNKNSADPDIFKEFSNFYCEMVNKLGVIHKNSTKEDRDQIDELEKEVDALEDILSELNKKIKNNPNNKSLLNKRKLKESEYNLKFDKLEELLISKASKTILKAITACDEINNLEPNFTMETEHNGKIDNQPKIVLDVHNDILSRLAQQKGYLQTVADMVMKGTKTPDAIKQDGQATHMHTFTADQLLNDRSIDDNNLKGTGEIIIAFGEVMTIPIKYGKWFMPEIYRLNPKNDVNIDKLTSYDYAEYCRIPQSVIIGKKPIIIYSKNIAYFNDNLQDKVDDSWFSKVFGQNLFTTQSVDYQQIGVKDDTTIVIGYDTDDSYCTSPLIEGILNNFGQNIDINACQLPSSTPNVGSHDEL